MPEIKPNLNQGLFVPNDHGGMSRVLHMVKDEPTLHAVENLLIGIGMGWDLDGLIEVVRSNIGKALSPNPLAERNEA